MADCNELFKEFHGNIILIPTKKESLKKARNALRDRIKKHFQETMKEKVPRYRGQGSYSQGIIVTPLDGEFDIDDGVYLQNLSTDKSKWSSPETVHQWIYNAVEGHTEEKPQNKRTCVRVIYKGEYHVDLPIYCMFEDQPFLAETGDAGWHISDPKALGDWIKTKIQSEGEQLKRIIQYIKAWKDYKSKSGNLPSGLILSILAINHFECMERDDSSFAGTVRNIYDQISSAFIVHNPVDYGEILSDNATDPQKENLIERLDTLCSKASDALKKESLKVACKIWRSEFGERFFNCEDIKDDEESEKALVTSAPAILKDNARSAI